jgi:hypothetical protein
MAVSRGLAAARRVDQMIITPAGYLTPPTAARVTIMTV